MTKKTRRAAARKAAKTRRRNTRRTVARVIVGKRREFVMTQVRTRRGVITTVKAAPGWEVVRKT